MRIGVMLCVVWLGAPSALAQFDTANINGDVNAYALVASGAGTDEENNGGPFSGYYAGLNVMFNADAMVGPTLAFSSASQDTAFTPTMIVSNASVGSDVDGYEEGSSKVIASGFSSMTVEFTITEAHTWSFTYGSVGGTHAGGYVQLYLVGAPAETRSAPVFYYDSIAMPTFDGETGVIQAGTYLFSADISAFTNGADGFGGLFADASWSFEFVLTPGKAPPPCPGDADGNGVVNFADITNVLTNFGMDYTPGTGPGDADHNGIVNFADVTNVLTNFGVPCP